MKACGNLVEKESMIMPKIGIGLCTYNRPEKALEIMQAIRNSTDNVRLVCAIDGGDFLRYDLKRASELCDELIIGENRGMIENKNRLLVYLQNFDCVFLMDDDLVPIKKGWLELYLEALKVSGYEHLNYIHEIAKYTKLSEVKYTDEITLEYYKDLGGALMVMTKKCLDTVGILDPEYKFYGYGHCDYTRRCQMAGLCPSEAFGNPHIKGIEFYLKLDTNMESVTSESDKIKFMKINGARHCGGSKRVYIPIEEFI